MEPKKKIRESSLPIKWQQTINSLVTQWEFDQREQSTIDTYRPWACRLFALCLDEGILLPARITNDCLVKFTADYDGYSLQYRTQMIHALNCIITDLHRLKIFTAPLQPLKLPEVPGNSWNPQLLGEGIVETFIGFLKYASAKSATARMRRTILWTLLGTGLKGSEVPKLQWSKAIRNEQGIITAFKIQRDGRWIEIAIDETLAATLDSWRQYREELVADERKLAKEKKSHAWCYSDCVFPGPTGAPLTKRSVYTAVAELAKRAGLAIKPYQLRQWLIAGLIGNGAPVSEVQAAMGHKELRSTRAYADK